MGKPGHGSPSVWCLLTFAFVPDALATPDFDLLWDYAQPAVIEAKFRALLPELATRTATYQIARAQGLQGRAEQAMLDTVQGIVAADPSLAEAGIRLRRARPCPQMARRAPIAKTTRAARAHPFFLQAWEAAQAAAKVRGRCCAYGKPS